MPGKNGHHRNGNGNGNGGGNGQSRNGHARNDYKCTLERNQSGKYCVRIRAYFPRHNWVLSAYFMASSFDRSMKKLEQSLQFLQRDEDRLWFWGVDRSDDPALSGEMLREVGLKLDRRADFPLKSTGIQAPLDQPVAAFLLAPVRRHLAESVESSQPRAALVGN
jgi:hypothetical protein